MGLRSKTFFVYKGEGGLQEARYFLRNAVGFNGELISRMEGVLFQPDVVHLTVYYQDREDYAVRATSPGPGAFIGTGITVDHLSVLFSDKLENSSLTTSGFTFDTTALLTQDIYLEPNKYIARLRLSGVEANQSGFHSVQIDSSILRYTNGEHIQNSAVVGYSKAAVNAAYPGESYPYSAIRGRRGEVDIAGVIVSKNTPPNEIIDAFIRQSNISKDRIITSTTVALNNGNLYCFFIYFRTLEPQVIYYFPYNYSLALDVNAPSKLTVIFREPIDRYHITSESGIFQIATGWNGSSGIHPSQISVENDNKTVHIATSSWLNGAGIYDLRILGAKSKDGTIKTHPDIYNILVGPFSEPGAVFTGDVQAQTIFAGTGLTGIGSFFHVKYSGSSITGDLDGIRVGLNSLTTAHVRDGSLLTGDLGFHMVTSIRDVTNTATSGDVKIETVVGVGYSVFAVNPATNSVGQYYLWPLLVSGKSGVAYDNYGIGSLATAYVQTANPTISVSSAGVSVGVIGSGNIGAGVVSGQHIANNTVVRSINTSNITIYDNFYVSGRGTISLIQAGNGLLISGSPTAGTTLGRSGVITDPVDSSYLRVSGADNSISFVGDGIRVGTIGTANISGNAITSALIADSTVIRSINNDSSVFYNNFYLTGRGTVTLIQAGNGLLISGTAVGTTLGRSGVITDPVDGSYLRVSGADNSISFVGNGIRVGLIGTANLSGGVAVRSVVNGSTTLTDTVYITGVSGVGIANYGNGYQFGAAAANSSIVVSANGISVGTVTSGNFVPPYPISGIGAYNASSILQGTMSGWVGGIKGAGSISTTFDSTTNIITLTYATPAPPDTVPSYIETFLFG